jgi:hypothetical protein
VPGIVVVVDIEGVRGVGVSAMVVKEEKNTNHALRVIDEISVIIALHLTCCNPDLISSHDLLVL